MSDAGRRIRLGDELLRRFAAAVRGAQLYSAGHPLVGRGIDAFAETLSLLLAAESPLTLGIVDEEFVVADTPIPRAAETMGELMRRLLALGVERIVFERGIAPEETAAFVNAVATAAPRADGAGPLPIEETLRAITHVRVGRLQIQQRVESSAGTGTLRRLYQDAVNMAQTVWDSARAEGQPDATVARGMIDSLAQTVARNRTALLALTALRNYDNYTFTHMVNVSILTMGQARGLGIEGALLREFGLAALMHDIGKVRTPAEILTKPEKLTEGEFAVMKRHTVDGAEILRRTPDIPALAPVVAFEHHLRADGTGYPDGVSRSPLNLGTMLCGIADVYDAMRSQRAYQQSFPTDRILAVLKRNDGAQFDQHLVRRFVQLVGIYPAGNVVRLDTGETAVVLAVYAPDPYRPRVRIVVGADGVTLERPRDVDLWEAGAEGGPGSIVAPLDPAGYDFDPLELLNDRL